MRAFSSRTLWALTLAGGLISCEAPPGERRSHSAGVGELDRTVLPVPEPVLAPITELDVRKAKAPPRFEVKAPAGAPNVLLVLIDDFGYGQASTFGGGVNMPTLERLARNGLLYNRFHVAALCSPTRMALLTGRNHHSTNTGAVMDIATAFPGYTGVRPNSVAPLAEILRLNGYSTSHFGKCHETALWETSPSGPTDRWPTRAGMDKFYGFLAGETNHWSPTLYDGLTRVEIPNDPNYHFTTDMTNQAIAWVRQQQSMTPERPFFLYYAPGATHAPHHVPKEWADKYKGKFDMGWDRYREETLARQKQLGIVPQNTRLAPKPEVVKDWDKLSDTEKMVFARQMEIYAGFGEQVDYEIGRLVGTLEELGELENTLIFYIVGDNGASAEGGMVGVVNEMTFFNGVAETLEQQLAAVDKLGGPFTYAHYAVGWAVAGNTPFNYAKQVASNFGGSRNPLVVHWPHRIRAKREVRTQFHHVIDVAPTVLEAARLPEPRIVNGTPQRPIEGVSFLYTFDDAKAPGRRRTQYFEIAGNRGIYHDGWFAGTVHRAPWEAKPRAPLDQDRWELYDLEQDFSQAVDLSARHPDKLKQLQARFMEEAVKYSVLPIDDRSVERLNPVIAGRPDLMGARTSLTLYEGTVGLGENAFINLKNRSHAITAELSIPKAGAEGVVASQGGRFGGWSLYVKDGKPHFVYNLLGIERTVLASPDRLPEGDCTLRYEFAVDAPKPGSGGAASILVNGKKVAEGRISRTTPFLFSPDETANVGVDEETPVTEDYREHLNRFTGKIRKVTFELK